MTDEEAKRQNLPGSDVYKGTHLAYHDDLNRNYAARAFHVEAYKTFFDTILITQFPQLQKEARKASLRYFPPMTFRRIEVINLENFKIATGFELHFKACLLLNNIIIRKIKNKVPFKDLYREQKKRPIDKNELFNIEGYYYTGTVGNILRGLSEESLGFKTILNERSYRQALNKTEEILNIAEDYRNLRNQIHLPGDFIEAPHINSYQGDELMRLLVSFINTDIVGWVNSFCDREGLSDNWRLQPLNYF